MDAQGMQKSLLPNNEELAFPMTQNQVGLFLHHMMDPTMQISTIIGVADVDVNHEIDCVRLDSSFQAAFREHVALHGVYKYNEDDGFRVSIRKPELAPTNHIILHKRGSFEEDKILNIAAQTLSGHGNIGIQLHLFELYHKTVLVFTTFQFILDGFSVGMFINDVMRRYTTGESLFPKAYLVKNMRMAASVPKFQAESFTSRHGVLKNYWLNHLRIPQGKALPTLSISAPPPSSSPAVSQPSEVRFTIDPSQFLRVQQLSKMMGVRTSSIFLSVWALLLSRYAQQVSILISVVFSGRGDSRYASSMGSFACQLPLLVDFPQLATPFAEFIQSIGATISDHVKHQDYAPLQMMKDIREAAPQYKHLSVLGDADFNYFNIPKPEPPMARWQVANGIQQGTLPLSLWMFSEGSHGNQEVTGWIKYNVKMFDRKFVEQMTTHYSYLLGQVLDHPLTPLRGLQLCATEVPRDRLRLTTTVPFLPVHKLVELAAFASPLRTAVIFEDEGLTYQQLLQCATRVALHLQSAGVKTGDIVGLMHKRSLNMVVAMLGVMMAGAAYTPLDPTLPSTRLQQMLGECKCDVVLTTSDMLTSPLLRSSRVRPMTVETLLRETPAAAVLQNSASMNNLAYTVFTSGTTGVPKGIAVHHAPLVHLIQWAVNHFELRNPRSVFLTALQISFDPHVFDIFTTLCAGATVVITKDGGLRDPQYLLGLMEAHSVTHFACVPSLLSMLLTTSRNGTKRGTGHGLSTLTHLLVGGEGLPWNLAREAAGRLPRINLWNMYGPAEATIVSTCYSVTKNMNQFQQGGVVPIGRPLPGVAAVVLGNTAGVDQVAPKGIVGELCVFGKNLSRGYLTKGSDTFVDHPYLENVKMYKTGDLVRERDDGVLEYVGRKDTQVKLRGHRIELSEITSTLLRTELWGRMIEFATCRLLTQTNSGKQFLALYLVLKNDLATDSLSRETAGKILSDNLPPYMVPEYIVFLPSLALSHNGKADVNNFPYPTESDKWDKNTDYVAPTTPVEQNVCEAFAQVLECGQVGITHNFFSTGGTSMLAINCLQLIKQKCGKSLTVPQFYANPTPAQLGKLIADETVTGEKTFIQLMYSPKKMTSQKPRKLFLVPGAIRTSLVFTQLVESLPETFPFEVYSFTDPDGLLDGVSSSDPQTMSDIVTPYLREMIKIQPRNTGVYYIMGYSLGGLVAMELSNWLKANNCEVKLIMADTRNPTKAMKNMDISTTHAMLAEEIGLRYNYVSNLTASVLRKHAPVDQQALLVSEIVDHKILDKLAAEKLVEKSSNYFKTATSILGKYHIPKLDIPVTLLSASQNRFHELEATANTPAPAPQQQPQQLRQLVQQAQQQLQQPTTQQPTQQHDLGWGTILGKWLSIVKVPGDHFTMLLKPHVNEFAHVLLQELSKPHSGKAKL